MPGGGGCVMVVSLKGQVVAQKSELRVADKIDPNVANRHRYATFG